MDEIMSAKVHDLVRKTASLVGGEFDVTKAGTPRIILQLPQFKCSVVYISRTGQWKLFFPFPAPAQEQRKMYFEGFDDFYTFVKEGRDAQLQG